MNIFVFMIVVIGDAIMNDNMTADEILSAINHQWATTKDIMKIASIGEARALKIKKNLYIELSNKGYILPRDKVPMEEIVKIFKINIEFLKKISNERKKNER